jgi:hypothetical protein
MFVKTIFFFQKSLGNAKQGNRSRPASDGTRSKGRYLNMPEGIAGRRVIGMDT